MTGVATGVASLAGVLAAATLLGSLVWVVAIALLGVVVAHHDGLAPAVAVAVGLLAVASAVFVVAVVAIEFIVSGAWIAG
jgi:hypothetical protein